MATYCSHCGEKRQDPTDWKLSSILGEAFSEITDLEHSKLWQTFRLLLFKPGQLTRHYWNGRRKRYLGPIKLYLVFFAVTLLFYSIHRPTAVYDVRTFTATNSKLARHMDDVAKKRGVPADQVTQEVNSNLHRYLSTSQLFYPLVVALALRLLLRRRRLHFAEHFIFALHILTFIYLTFLVAWPLFVLFGIDTSRSQYTPAYLAITFASLVWTAAYLLLALRRAYGEPWIPALVKGFLLFVTYMLSAMFFMGVSLTLALALSD